MDKPVTNTQKCERKSCMFGKHPKQKHGWCCASCKNDGCHGPSCIKLKWEGKMTEKSDSESSEEVVDSVRNEVKDFCRQAFSGMLSNFMEDKRTKQANVKHTGYECDGCEINPIKGIRYKCSVCPDYDLCEGCEAKGVHAEHPMLKIRDPAQAPIQLICQYKDIPSHKDAVKAPFKKCKQKAQWEKKPFVRYTGRFVKESFGDKYIVMPGEKIRKTWTFRNDGKTNWPEDTQFIQTNGDNMDAVAAPMAYPVTPESEYTWGVDLTAPEKEGRYQCYFRMVTGG